MPNIKILYEDNHIIAVVKPAGVLSQGDKTGDVSMLGQVRKYLKDKYNKPGNVFVGLLHRLDRPVSGILLFAKTSKGASRLSEQFRNHTIQKTYHGIVSGMPKEKEGHIKEDVNKISFFAQGFAHKTDEEILAAVKKATKTRAAELTYHVVKTGKPFDTAQGKSEYYSLLKIMPKTGRFHQIRIQMSQIGHSILGDVKYRGQKWHDQKSIALCATGISFQAATGEKRVELAIELPKDWEKYLSTATP